MLSPIYIQAFESISAVGLNRQLNKVLFDFTPSALSWQNTWTHRPLRFGLVDDRLLLSKKQALEIFSELNSLTNAYGRTNQLIATCLDSLRAPLDRALKTYSPHRIGVIMGASVSGMSEMERVYSNQDELNQTTDRILEIANPAKFIASALHLTGPTFVISTACSSSSKALASAARLLQSDIIDFAICGGIDSASAFTLSGFDSLGALSHGQCQPFGANRDGINLGEGGAIFLLSREPSSYELAGWSETSDGYHISSPDPLATQVKKAMLDALEMAKVDSVDYINAHGTGTIHNDAMEGLAIESVFTKSPPWVSSTKSLTGHTLGGAGALEAAICLLAMQTDRIPIHRLDSPIDKAFSKLKLALSPCSAKLGVTLSNSFAFGGNNAVLVFKKVTL